MLNYKKFLTLLSFLLLSFSFQHLQAQSHVITTTMGGGFLGDGDIYALHIGVDYSLQLGDKWQPYVNFALYNGLGSRVGSAEILRELNLVMSFEASQGRLPYLAYNNGWNAGLGIMYRLNRVSKSRVDIGGGLSLMASNQVNLTSSRISDVGEGRIVLPTTTRFIDPGVQIQVRYLYELSDHFGIGFNFNTQSSFNGSVYTFGGLNLSYRL